MRRTLGVLTALIALIVLVLWLGGAKVSRDKPPTPEVSAPNASGVLVVDLQDDATDADLLAIEAALGADFDWTSPLSRDEGLIEGRVADLERAVETLRGNALVEVAEPEIQMEAFGYPNDPLYDRQWNLRAMGAPTGWATTPRGKGVIVAVVDTGVSKVEDLRGTNLLAGATFVSGTTTSADDNGHGTHVSGTIAQTTNNGVGVAGVAPAATILPVKVLSGAGFGSSSWIAAGIDYAVDQGADVINLSLGGGYSRVIHNAIRKATNEGVIVVAAAGNSGREGVSYPGALWETIGVSATGPDGLLAPYSSWGKGVDLAAPGGDKRKTGGGVLQDTIDGKGGHQYAEFQGTSMATPHVAGAAAVLLSTGMDAASVEDALLSTAHGGSASDPKLGHGHLDLGAALTKVVDAFSAIRFLLAALVALLVTHLTASRPRFRAIAVGVSGAVAGGLFFLEHLRLPDFSVVHLLARPLLLWPAVLLDSRLVNFPLWLSSLLPALFCFTFGAFRPTRAVALGLSCGIGVHLIHGAATGTLHPWWFPTGYSLLWLVGNGVTCVLFALALAGAEKLDQARR